MADINIKVPAVDKLLEMFSRGFGAVAGPWLVRRDAEAKAEAVRLITQELEGFGKNLKAGGSVAVCEANVSIAERVQVDLRLQAEKRTANIASVVREAKAHLEGAKVPDAEVDSDWAARFFDGVKDVSSAELRKIWARILAGEVETPGRSSLRTLDVLKNMTMEDAKTFERFAGCVVFDESPQTIRAAVFNPPWGGVIGGHELMHRPMHDAEVCLSMQDAELFMPADKETWKAGFGWISPCPSLPYGAHSVGDHWGIALVTVNSGGKENPPTLPVFSATRAGRELAGFLDHPPNDQYLACLARCLLNQSHQLLGAKIVGRDGSGKLLKDWRLISGE